MSRVTSSRIRRTIATYRPSHLKVLLIDYLGRDYPLQLDFIHLKAAIDWLCIAQDQNDTGGVSGGYFLKWGWRPPYAETTGYIIPTFIQYATLTNDSSYIDRCIKMGDWQINIQLESGAIRGGMGVIGLPNVFNTGQVVLGWTQLYKTSRLERYIEAAIKGANWLVSVQDDDGKWSRHTYQGIARTYHTRVAWSLFELFEVSGEEKYRAAAKRNLYWAISCVKNNFWFDNMTFFRREEHALTHTIAYTLRGLLESLRFLSGSFEKKVCDVVLGACEKLLRAYELRKTNPYSRPDYLSATFNQRWQPQDTYCCLTGIAQIAIIFHRVYEITGDARFLNAALKLLDQLKARQNLSSRNAGIRGAIAGSYPLWGGYMSLGYPNWATKFFADALISQERIMRVIEE